MKPAGLVLCRLLALLATPVAAQPPRDLWTGFDSTSYELILDARGHKLVGSGRAPVVIPKAWLGRDADDEDNYLTSREWGRPVTAFPLGDGRRGLHLSFYAAATEGSARRLPVAISS